MQAEQRDKTGGRKEGRGRGVGRGREEAGGNKKNWAREKNWAGSKERERELGRIKRKKKGRKKTNNFDRAQK